MHAPLEPFDLWYNGFGSFNCWVTVGAGEGQCAGRPMRVCSGGSDFYGNFCDWTDCGFGTQAPNQFFGGCAGGNTAGTLCCPTGLY